MFLVWAGNTNPITNMGPGVLIKLLASGLSDCGPILTGVLCQSKLLTVNAISAVNIITFIKK